MAWQAEVEIAGRYRLIERLGAGGVAEVWRAEDTVLRRDVAVKLLLERLMGDDETVERFRREASTAAGIAHPHAVVIFDVGEHAGVPFLVMELVDGPTLAAVLRSGPIDASLTAAIGYHIASALGAAHGRGLVHRDIKPANVLLSSSGSAKLADFGIATALGPATSRLTDPGNVVGTAGYLAPEQLESETVDARSDVYALGLVLHECLSGLPVFGDGTATEIAARRLTQDPPALAGTGAPADLQAAIVTATRREPADRYPDGAAMARALAPLVTEGVERRVARLGERSGTLRLKTEVAPTAPVTQRVAATRVVNRDERAETPEEAQPARAPAPATPVGAPSGGAPEVAGGPPVAWWRRNATPLLAGGIVLVGLLAVGLTAGEPDDGGADGSEGGGGQLAAIAAVTDVDPLGDGREHPEDVAATHDGDPGSSWSTERYEVADLSAIKRGDGAGVGLVFDLGEVRRLLRVQLATTPGVSLEVYVWEELADLGDRAAWGDPVETVDGLDNDDLTLELDTDARHVLVWFTQLAPADRGFRANIREIAFLVGG